MNALRREENEEVLRPDGALLRGDFRVDPAGRMVKGRKADRPHEHWFEKGWITAGLHDAADRYLTAYERGLYGGRNMFERKNEAPAERFHESRSHWLHILMQAQAAMRAHERTVLDCALVAGMSLDAYALECLGLGDVVSKPVRIGQVQGLIVAGLCTLCEHWKMRA